MYRKAVVEFKLTKYSKAPAAEDFTAPASHGIKQWICRTCFEVGKVASSSEGQQLAN